MNGTNLHEYATCLSIHRQQSRHGNHQMTSLKINKALNIRTIANYVKEVGGGGGSQIFRLVFSAPASKNNFRNTGFTKEH